MTIGIYKLRLDEWFENHMRDALADEFDKCVADGLITPQWGFVEHGQCPACNTYNDLWVYSTATANIAPRCLSCFMPGFYNSWSVSMDMQSAYLVINNPDTWDIEDYERCWSCDETIASSREPIMALLNDDSQVKVHDSGRCRTKCYGCNNIYAAYSWANERTYGKVVNFETIYGDHRCRTCYNQEIEDGGGEDSFFDCGNCGSVFHEDTGYNRDHTPGTVCEGCYDNYTYTCDDCNETYWDGEHYCEADDDEDEGCIHDYSYKPRPFFFGDGSYHLGFELEVEANGNSRAEGAEIVQTHLKERVYMKSDGSLNDGFEIVSHPHTLKEYATNFNWSVLETLRREGYRSWNTETCGLHVHVSRSAFGNIRTRADITRAQAHELRFMKLIYDNQRQVERIAGRSSNHYATFSDKGHLIDKVKHSHQRNGRYSVVNTENENTVEVRIFKGSLRKERVMSAIEFVTAAVEYTRDLKVAGSKNPLSWLHFTAFVAQNVEQYPNLSAHMEKSFSNDQTPSND